MSGSVTPAEAVPSLYGPLRALYALYKKAEELVKMVRDNLILLEMAKLEKLLEFGDISYTEYTRRFVPLEQELIDTGSFITVELDSTYQKGTAQVLYKDLDRLISETREELWQQDVDVSVTICGYGFVIKEEVSQ